MDALGQFKQQLATQEQCDSNCGITRALLCSLLLPSRDSCFQACPDTVGHGPCLPVGQRAVTAVYPCQTVCQEYTAVNAAWHISAADNACSKFSCSKTRSALNACMHHQLLQLNSALDKPPT